MSTPLRQSRSHSHSTMAQQPRPLTPGPSAPEARPSPHAYRAFRILQIAFGILPIVTGTDKFLHVLVNWDQYLSPAAIRVMGSHTHAFMRAAGALEILLGIGMLAKPEIFSYVISAWLLGIVLNLLLAGAYFDIALRDFALVLVTFALGEMSHAFQSVKRTPKQSP